MILSACAGYDASALTRVLDRTDSSAKPRISRLQKLIKSAKLKGGKKLKSRFKKIALH